MSARRETEAPSLTDTPDLSPALVLDGPTRPEDVETTTPFLPPAVPIAVEAPSEAVFDAAAMVAADKGYTPNPSYGAMPEGTAEGLAAARDLRQQANRKRRRRRIVGRIVILIALVGIGVGGYFAYSYVRDSLDGSATDDSSAADAADATEVAAGGEPLGGSDDAFDATPAVPRAATAIVESDVLPIVLESVSTRLPDEAGFDRYVIDGEAFEVANVGAFQRFVEVASAQPQGESAAFALLPTLGEREIGLAVQRTDGDLARVVIATADRSLAVDVAL